VHYSIGGRGEYLLHVGLRQKEAYLPGSPFLLTVKPGSAHAPSTMLPEKMPMPLETMVGTTGTLLLRLSDNMGNQCIEGGAPLKVEFARKGVTASCEDHNDGTCARAARNAHHHCRAAACVASAASAAASTAAASDAASDAAPPPLRARRDLPY
jgi:hypothetical protein